MTKVARALSLIALLVASGYASAQCATGVDTGGGNCMPPDAPGMPGYNTGSVEASPPAAVWEDTWGAIVLDLTVGAKGVSTRSPSKSDAIRSAMTECQSAGATHCEVQLTYYSQCAAVAWGDKFFSVAKNKTAAQANQDAIDACSQKSSGCKVAYSDCSPPRRVR